MAYAIKKGSDYFTTVLYTGDGSTNRTISVPTLTPDFTWIKARSIIDDHIVYDTVRQGLAGAGARIKPNSTEAESDLGDYVDLITNGFKVSTGTYNNSGVTFASWNWKAGGTAVSNTDGDITTLVSANPTSGFSVVSWVADNSASTRIGHGLGTTPKIAIIKNRNTVSNWQFYTTAIDGSYDFLYLNLTNAKTDSGLGTFTSTTIAAGGTSTNTDNMIAYCFADVEGYSKMGTYTGNGLANGPFVYTGFRPAFVLFKKSSGAEGWYIKDTEREQYNVMDRRLSPNSNAAEGGGTSGDYVDFLSNGFKCRDGAGQYNEASQNYIYMAFAETPFKYANAR